MYNILLIKEIIKYKKLAGFNLNEAEESFIQSINLFLRVKIIIIKKRSNIKLVKYSLFNCIFNLNLL